MAGTIQVCADWRQQHERPRYTLGSTCPDCDADTRPAAPAKFSPEDRYGEYRRALLGREARD